MNWITSEPNIDAYVWCDITTNRCGVALTPFLNAWWHKVNICHFKWSKSQKYTSTVLLFTTVGALSRLRLLSRICFLGSFESDLSGRIAGSGYKQLQRISAAPASQPAACSFCRMLISQIPTHFYKPRMGAAWKWSHQQTVEWMERHMPIGNFYIRPFCHLSYYNDLGKCRNKKHV